MGLFGRRGRRDGEPEPHELVRRGDLDGLRRWAAEGGRLDETDAHGETALQVAYTIADFAAVDVLEELGADPHRRDRRGGTPYQLFAHLRGQPAYVLRVAEADLLARVADHVDAIDADRNTALHLAWLSGRQEAARRLVAHGASTTKTNRFGLVPTDMAMVPEYADWLGELSDSRTMPLADHLALRQAPPAVVTCALAGVIAARRRPRLVLRCGIRLGIPATVEVLVRALWERGDKWIATDYLNSGHTTLSTEASQWALQHGFEIVHPGQRRHGAVGLARGRNPTATAGLTGYQALGTRMLRR